tara:strand:+ start:107 stop:889 length:783 start_codon:yes stop_codon:yes gene_type:complete
MKKSGNIKNVILDGSGLAILFVILLVTMWEILVKVFDVKTWLLPSPTMIFLEIVNSFSLIMKHTLITINEIIVGLAIAIIMGLLLAWIMVWSRVIERTIYPIVIASQTIPIIALAPLLLVWVGPEVTSKIIVVVLISFFPIVVTVTDGLRNIDKEMVAMFKTFGANRWQTLFKLQIPHSLPSMFSGMKVAAVSAVIGAVVGEWVGGQGGLGWLIKVSGPQFQTDRVFASIVVLSITAVILFLIVTVSGKFVLRNHGPKEN